MSLLIVRCPLKPLLGAVGASGGTTRDEQDLADAERFEWCYVQDEHQLDSAAPQFGVGTTESMPYADEVLVLLPTIDVRLIEAKVPLANAKKLAQILPNLIEEYVLTGAQSLAVQALPPVPGKPAVQRVIALIDRTWFAWLCKQLEGLISQRVRLIPECFVLPVPIEGERSVAYQQVDANLIVTVRSSEQLGLAWLERVVGQVDSSAGAPTLPQSLMGVQAQELSWDLVLPGALQFLQENTSSKAAHFSLNLLPKTFRRPAGNASLGLTQLFKRKPKDATLSAKAGATWSDPLVWRQPVRWAKYFVISVVAGYGLHLAWLVLDNWRWTNQMEVLAAQSLTPASVAKLNGENGAGKLSSNAVITAFIKQVTQDQRRQGLVSDADFGPMAAKLQQLKAAFGPEVLQSLDYDGYRIDFEFKPGSVPPGSAVVVQKARSLGLVVTPQGPNRYRLEPYAGLGGGL